MEEVVSKLKNQIIVSVQAEGNEPLNKPEHLLAVSLSVVHGGAGGLRLSGIKNINHIKKKVQVPIIGLTKIDPIPFNYLDSVYITGTMKDLRVLINTGIDFIAIDGTGRPRVDGATIKDQINLIKKEKRIALCDVSNIEEGLNVIELGADLISTTLSGYTRDTRYKVNEGPDFDLLADLCEGSPVPVIMEGRVWTPENVKTAFEIGAHAVVIGTAITKPHMIVRRFVSAVPQT